MISEARMRGDGIYLSISADTSIYAELRRLHNISATTTGLKVKFADARRYKKGRKLFQVWNSGSNSFALCTDDAVTLTTLTAGQWATCSLIDNTTQAGVWMLHVGTAGSAPQAPPTQLMYYAGGSSNNKRMDEYNQTSDTWTNKTNAGVDRQEGSCSTLGGAGIYAGSDTTDNRLVEHYDPDTWTAGTSMPGLAADGSSGDCASTMTGKVYVFGGNNVNLRTIEYDGATWTTKTSRPAGRGFTPSTSGGFPGFDINSATTYLLHGGTTVGEGHAYVDQYVSDTYTAKTERGVWGLREGRAKYDAGGEIFVFGGAIGSLADYVTRVTKYVVSSDTHVACLDYSIPTEQLMASSYGTKCYVGFGRDDLSIVSIGYVTHFFEYDMVNDTYMTKTDGLNTKQNFGQNQGAAIPP